MFIRNLAVMAVALLFSATLSAQFHNVYTESKPDAYGIVLEDVSLSNHKIVANTVILTSGQPAVRIARIKETGAVQWSQVYPLAMNPGGARAMHLMAYNNNRFILLGLALGGTSQPARPWILTFDPSNGDIDGSYIVDAVDPASDISEALVLTHGIVEDESLVLTGFVGGHGIAYTEDRHAVLLKAALPDSDVPQSSISPLDDGLG
jgi:hypothetical protein